MTSIGEPERLVVCMRCGSRNECCAVCERDRCEHPICYRCLRLQVRQTVAHPHGHGG